MGRTVRTSKEARKNLILSIIAVLIALIFLFPLYWIVCMSFKSDAESFGKIVTYYPHNFTVQPWLENLTNNEFLSSLLSEDREHEPYDLTVVGRSYSEV